MDQDPARILVVDDNELARQALVRHVEDEGYQVLAAEDGASALGVIADGGVDLILLDVNMPGLSGLEVLENLRQLYSRTDLPVIIVTGKRDSSETVRAFDLGANDYVTKPVDFPQLLARIRAHLALRSPEASPFDQVKAGSLIAGTYRLGEKIGRGHFGAVYRAVHVKLRREVAIKLLRADFHDDPEAIARFEREGVATCRIQHPNAVMVLDFNVLPSGVPYLVMELLEGRPLATEIKVRQHLDPRRCAEILKPISEVLDEAHVMGLVHRDIKPQNVFLHQPRGREEVVKLLDFGIAKMVGLAMEEITLDDATPGTPAYMAPERISKIAYDGRADIYSLGIMLYAMLTGRPPFVSKNPIRLVLMQVHEAPVPLRDLRPDLPQAVDDVVLRALAKDPGDRPGSAGELARDFDAALED